MWMEWTKNLSDKQRNIINKTISVLPDFVKFQAEHSCASSSFEKTLDDYVDFMISQQKYSVTIAANIKLLKRKYKMSLLEMSSSEGKNTDVNSIITWHPLPKWASGISSDDLYYLDKIISHIPNLHNFLYKNTHNSDLTSLMDIFSTEYCPNVKNDNALQFGINSVKRTYQKIKEKCMDAMHYVSANHKIDDKYLLQQFQKDALNNFDRINIYNNDISVFLHKYIQTYHPYIDAYIAERLFKFEKTKQSLAFYSHVCRHIFAYPNLFWDNSEGIYGCACTIERIVFSIDHAQSADFSDENSKIVSLLVELCYLLSCRIIYWNDKDIINLPTYDAQKLPIQISDKIRFYNVCYRLIENNPHFFFVNGFTEKDLSLIQYSILRDSHIIAYKHKIVGKNSMYTQKAIELFQTKNIFIDYNPDSAYQEGALLNEKLSHSLYIRYRKGEYRLSQEKVTLVLNSIFKSKNLAQHNSISTPYIYNKEEIVFKANRTEIREYLKKSGITCFYHFTERGRLSSIIREGGILSYKECLNRGVAMPRTKDMAETRDIDAQNFLEDYARLSFCRYLPKIDERKLAGKDLVLLRIDVEVAEFADTRFTDIEATQCGFHHGPTLEDLMNVNLEAVKKTYCCDSDSLFWQYQAEVLIKSKVPLKYIKNIDNPENL